MKFRFVLLEVCFNGLFDIERSMKYKSLMALYQVAEAASREDEYLLRVNTYSNVQKLAAADMLRERVVLFQSKQRVIYVQSV